MRALKYYSCPMLVAAVVLALVACIDRGDPTAPGSPDNSNDVTLAVEFPVANLEVGHVVTASLKATNSAGKPVQPDSIEWSSSDTTILTVSSTGQVLARKMGAAAVEAKWRKRAGKGSLSVTDTVPAKVVVSPSSVSAAVGSQVHLSAAVATATGRTLSGYPVKWTSSNTRYVSVSSTGVVTGASPGSASVSAQASQVADSAVVSVANASIAHLSVSPGSTTLASGQTVALTANATDAAGSPLTGRAVGWESSDESIAAVSTGGVVTAGKIGSATITASAEGVRASASISVAAGDVKTVNITPGSIGLVAGAQQQLSASLEDDAGNRLSAQSVAWASANSSIATVSSSGLVTAVHVGSTAITAVSGSAIGRASVVVSAGAVKTISITPQSFSLVTGRTRQLSATLTDAAGNTLDGNAAWSSSDLTVATVSSTGLVTATHSGSATITAAAGGTKGTATLTVAAGSVSSITVSPGSSSLAAGETQQLSAKLTDNSGSTVTGQTATWSTSDASIVKVSSSGLATAAHVGRATITATAGGQTGSAAFSVSAGPVNSVEISPASASVEDGKTLQLTATFKDVAGNPVPGGTVAWTSSNASAATVNGSGLVTGVAAGSANITATADGNSKSAAITVTAPAKATLSTLTLNPSSISLAAGASQRFSVSATWSDGSSTAPGVTYSATGGTITSAGVYTAGNSAGSFRVVAVAQDGTKSDSSVVTITAPASAPPTLTRVTISPATATLAPNATAQFRTSATWSDGSTTSPAVSYSASGGSISSSGLYTAGSTGGSFRVIAADAGKADTSIVSITTGQLSQGASCSNPQNVSTVSELTNALSQAQPGACIVVASGTYTLGSGLTISNSGTASSPIVVEGAGSSTIIDVNQKTMSINSSYLHLRKVRLTNFPTVGLWLRGATGDVLDSVEIDHTQQEAIALKDGSNHNIVKNSLIHDTGLSNGQYAEGIYVGNSGESSPLDFGVTDNQILNNHFGPNVRAEAIDLKEGADRTVIRGNYIDGTGAYYYSGTGTLVAVKSSGVVIDDNYMQIGMQQAVAFEAPVASTMTGNVASGNRIDLRSSGYGFQFQAGTVNPMGAVIKCDNVMISGMLSNRPCTP